MRAITRCCSTAAATQKRPSVLTTSTPPAATISVVTASGVLVVNTLARFWVAASAEQQRVLARIRADHPALAPGTVLLLDGTCPYIGPAPVFETSWDLGGALQVAYADASLAGDVVTPRVEIEEEGVATRMYGAKMGPYPWDALLVYDAARGTSTRLAGPFDAGRYFEAWNARQSEACRSWREGYGEPLFPPIPLPVAAP